MEITNELSWLLGFLASDGHFIKNKTGFSESFTWCLHYKDFEVFDKFDIILKQKGIRYDYSKKEKSPSCVIKYKNKELVDNFNIIKYDIPNNLLNRHFLRGLVDEDGCINIRHRDNRETVRINIINMRKEIVDKFNQHISDTLKIPLKKVNYSKPNNVYCCEWEGKSAQLICWYLYHGNIDNMVLKRKHDIYKKEILKNQIPKNDINELFLALTRNNIFSYQDNNGIKLSVNVTGCQTLKWCKIIQNLIPIARIVPTGKGNLSYFEIYIPTINMQDIKLKNL